jgi:hypothetical protein
MWFSFSFIFCCFFEDTSNISSFSYAFRSNLANKKIKFVVFEGENAIEYFKDSKEAYYQKFVNRCVAEDS